jgi:hypothetical protein
MTFVFWQCEACARTYGEVAGLMVMPDEVYWERLRLAQLEHAGRPMTEAELLAVAETDASPLSTLLHERRGT